MTDHQPPLLPVSEADIEDLVEAAYAEWGEGDMSGTDWREIAALAVKHTVARLQSPPSASQDGAEARRAVAECVRIVREVRDGFLDEDYAVNQPESSFSERFACDEVARTIEQHFSLGTNEQKALLSTPPSDNGQGLREALGWQPIETLDRSLNERVLMVRFESVRGQVKMTMDARPCWPFMEGLWATHWMPLPAPPAALSGSIDRKGDGE